MKLPKHVHVIKCNTQMLGIRSSVFCFYDKAHASSVARHIERTQNMTVWDTSINPTKFLLYSGGRSVVLSNDCSGGDDGGEKDGLLRTTRRAGSNAPAVHACVDTYESVRLIEDLLEKNVSMRMIDNVHMESSSTCTLSSFCGIEASPTTDQMRTSLEQIY